MCSWYVQSRRASSIVGSRHPQHPQLASYPIYFPLYIGEFEFDPEETGGKKTRRITIVMDAHDENVRATIILDDMKAY